MNFCVLRVPVLKVKEVFMSFGVDEKIFEGKVELPSCAFTHGAKFHSDDVLQQHFFK